jgi:hypothetical protein
VKIGRWILLALVLAGAGYAAWKRYGGVRALAADDVVPGMPESMVPPGVRIKVEVLNGTRTAGLARKATMFLRDRGFDVVETGNAAEKRSSTLVLDRSGHPEWTALVTRAMSAKSGKRPDSTRYLDVTVILGDDWRPPPLPFYP